MRSIKNNILKIQNELEGRNIELVIVSKGRTINEIQEAYSCGIKDFGENRLQEALKKIPFLPKDIRWHFIGRLQKNKIPKIVEHFSLIHSADSYETVKTIAEISLTLKKRMPILLQVNTSLENTKAGLTKEEWKYIFPSLLDFSSVDIQGLMTMGPHTDKEELIRKAFKDLKILQEELQEIKRPLKVLSMGMSNDYRLAIEEGATLLRIGSKVFETCP